MSEAFPETPPNSTRQSFFDSLEAAEKAARRLKKGAAESGLVVRVERAPYSPGYLVRSVPIAFLAKRRLRPLLRPLARSYGK